MALRVLSVILFALAAWVLLPVTGGRAEPAAVTRHAATYDFYLGGIWAGKVDLDGVFVGGSYRAGVAARTAGIVGFFFRAGVDAETVGRIAGGSLSPKRFTANAYERRHRQFVDIAYTGRTVASIRAEPAYRVRPWSISPDDRNGFADPLSAAFEAFLPAPADAICDQTVTVFDGARRWAIEIGPPRPEGSRIACPAVYVRIAGFKPKLMGERARRPFTLFYQQRGDGLFHVVRAAGETSFGVAVLLLRG